MGGPRPGTAGAIDVGTFADISQVRRRGDGLTFDAELDIDWSIGDKPNGGYLLAIVARAACEVVDTVDPLAVTAHYLRAPGGGPAEVRTEIVRRGRRASVTRATLWQDDKPCIDALVTSGVVPTEVERWSAKPPPAMPAPRDCIEAHNPMVEIPLFDYVELRVDPATDPFPTPSGEPVVRYWFRLRDGSEPDVLSLLLASDSGPPTVFNLGKYGWAPTVELSVLLRARPEPGWLLVEARTEEIAGSWFDETAAVWDSAGRLVAQARQLALSSESLTRGD
jgi:acyl-CoA thioesterase